MSLVPYLMRDLIRELERPRMYDQYFGMPLTPSMLEMQPWKLLNQLEPGASIVNDKKNFKVSLDVQQFKPEELSVKVVDNFVVVEGKHEERRDNHGFVSRQFTRRYCLPDDVDTSALQTTLSSDGVLQLHAPKKLQEKNARNIPITQTNAPVVKAAKPQPQQEEEKKK
ncbi:protein lethal(2)essential for life-like [Macrosteles quadrilineatus]|uniref:protein lethal(2)essential for life-like n=1 Tax=Macrosteles quadrilineatus TaxID=74068 RepID=UPI0023E133F0|nr:protein lethal(2)essential for life-like [Macrosteles quadrilineatus]